jgi:two-component system, NarL family, response regulator NreC
MNECSVVIADDHTLFREGMKRILLDESSIKVVGEASDGAELLKLLDEVTADVVILDISMPNVGGLEAAERIKLEHPGVAVLILTMHKDEGYLHHAIAAGVDGFLLKEDADVEVFAAIDAVRNGEHYISSLLTEEMVRVIQRSSAEGGADARSMLTPREKQVLKLVAEGRHNRDVALILNISVRTVENHRASIMKKLKLSNTAELLRYAFAVGLVRAEAWP